MALWGGGHGRTFVRRAQDIVRTFVRCAQLQGTIGGRVWGMILIEDDLRDRHVQPTFTAKFPTHNPTFTLLL